MPPNTTPDTLDHHPAPESMKRTNNYWKDPHAPTETDHYWQDPSTAHGQHIAPEEKDAHPQPTHHPVDPGMKRVNSYWKDENHEQTGNDQYWKDPASAHDCDKGSTTTPTPSNAEEKPLMHHPIDSATMPRVNSYWKEPHQQTTTDQYWNDPQQSHGHHHQVPSKKETDKPAVQHHPAPEGIERVESYWKEPHERTGQDSYWEDPANAHGRAGGAENGGETPNTT